MSRTIDVGGTGRGWPPSGHWSRKLQKQGPLVAIASGLFALMLLFGGAMAITGKLGVAIIDAEEVGVVVNYLTGDERVVTTPGYEIYVPFIQEVYTFDKTTQDFEMLGSEYKDNNHVPSLTVRAKDGSNFSIDGLNIQYQIIPGEADDILHDSGAGDGFKESWILAHARSVLRDEFGRYSAVEVADPTVYKQAPVAAKDRLNELLAPHGIRVVLITTPNPKFDNQYEDAIEERKEANQEVERLVAKVEQLAQEREQRLAMVKKEKEVEMQQLQGELIRLRRQAEADAIRVTKGADEYSARRVAEGQANKGEFLAQAKGLEAKYRKEAEGIESRAQALEQRGEVVVREAIIQKLLEIEFTLVPYSKDPAPKRLEHAGENTTTAQWAGGEQGRD